MKLSKYSAVQIVRELGSVIKHHVNIMDDEGYIIASTDEDRVGYFHEAAKKVIDERIDELVIMDENLFSGVKKGINYPIVFEGEIVGVVGITGEYELVATLGQIIKKMAEILLRDDQHQRLLRSGEQARRQYLEEWLYGEEPPDEPFAARGLRLGIDIERPRRLMAFAIRREKPPEDTLRMQEEMEEIEKITRNILRSDGDAVLLTRRNRFVLGVSEQSNKRLQVLFDVVKRNVLKQCGVVLVAGADGRAAQGGQARAACRNAEEALKAAMLQREQVLCFYDEIALELLLSEIPGHVKTQYVAKLFAGCTPEELVAWIHLLEVYFSCDGSVNQTAEQLFMHKNTLQYKLRKLKEITGYDPRNPAGVSCLYMAVQFFRNELS